MTKNKNASTGKKQVNWIATLLVSIFFGGLGIDRFMMGHVGSGMLKLFLLIGGVIGPFVMAEFIILTFIFLGTLCIWQLIDIILIATKHKFKGVEWVTN